MSSRTSPTIKLGKNKAKMIVAQGRQRAALLVAQEREKAALVLEQAKEAAKQLAEQANVTLQATATAAAQAVVREFLAGPGLVQVIHSTVGATLKQLGIDADKPEEVRSHMNFLKEFSETMALIKHKGISTVVVAVVGALMAALGAGITVLFHR